MPHVRSRSAVALGCFLILAGCGGPSPHQSTSEGPKVMTTLAAQDSGRTVTLGVGEMFEVKLPARPTAGYRWEIVSVDTAVVRRRGEGEFVAAGNAPGAGGIATLRFEVVGAGRTKLVLAYRRPFEKETPPEAAFEVDVTAK